MSRTFAWPYQPSLTFVSRFIVVQKFSERIFTLAPHSNCGSCDRTGIVCCCKQQIGRAHVCSMGPKYLKCFRRKKDRMEFVECLSHYNKAIDAHTSLTHKGIITHEKKKKRKKKRTTMKANEKFQKCVRGLKTARLVFAKLRWNAPRQILLYMKQTWSRTPYYRLKSTLKFHTNQWPHWMQHVRS